VRLFLASWLGADNQSCYGQLAARLAGARREVRPVPAGSVHLTYAFIADVDETGADAIARAAATTAAAHAAFVIGLGRAKVFWQRRTPRLVEVPVVSGARAFTRLCEALVAAIRREIPEVPLSPSKSPHATVARFRRHATPSDALALEQAIDVGERVDMVHEIAIVASRLTPNGPVYDTRSSVRLR
jgi:2'-5' RNA ligase